MTMENRPINDSYRDFQKNRQKLAEILASASGTARRLNMTVETDLAALSRKVENDTFKIMVTGTFKNGKSTFINALLGEEILPAYALPCTAVINEVKYGTEKKAILYFRNPLPDPLPENLSSKAVAHMQAHQGGPIPPMEIPYDEIEDYVVIPIGADEKSTKMQSPYEKLELFYPLDLLKNGVEIIDSPGLNEDETRTRVTMEYLSRVDAILYVLNANAICAGDEMKFIERDLKGNSYESVFFIVNRFDQIRQREQPQVRRYAEMKIAEFYPQPEIYCLSALNALDGRLDGNETLVADSGILPLEQRLAAFLTREKGKAKLATPARQLRQILSREALENVIPRQRALLDTALDDIIARYDHIRPRLDMASRERDQKAMEMETRIERAGRKFERLSRRQINDLISAVPAWIEEYKPQNTLGPIPTKSQTTKLVEEYSACLREKIGEAQLNWREQVLAQEVEDEASQIFGEAEKDFSRIYKEIDEISAELSGQDCKAAPVPFWKRVAGVAGGIAMGDIGLAFSGSINGIGKEFAITAAFEFGATFILALLGALNPVTFIGVILTSVFINVGQGTHNATAKLKTRITEEAVKKLTSEADRQAAAMAAGIQARFEGIKDQILRSITSEINDLDRQIQDVIKEKRSGEARVEARRQELAECEKNIYELNAELDSLIFTLVGA